MRGRSTPASTLFPEYVLIGLLAQQSAHGYDLHQRLTADLGQIWHISLSQTYSLLHRLEARGLISGDTEASAKTPPRRHFHVTVAGRHHFESWLKTPTASSSRAIRLEFLTRLYFAQARGPDCARAVLDGQVAATRAGLAELERLFAELPADLTFNRLGIELRIRQISSALQWLDDCRAALGLSA